MLRAECRQVQCQQHTRQHSKTPHSSSRRRCSFALKTILNFLFASTACGQALTWHVCWCSSVVHYRVMTCHVSKIRNKPLTFKPCGLSWGSNKVKRKKKHCNIESSRCIPKECELVVKRERERERERERNIVDCTMHKHCAVFCHYARWSIMPGNPLRLMMDTELSLKLGLHCRFFGPAGEHIHDDVETILTKNHRTVVNLETRNAAHTCRDCAANRNTKTNETDGEFIVKEDFHDEMVKVRQKTAFLLRAISSNLSTIIQLQDEDKIEVRWEKLEQ